MASEQPICKTFVVPEGHTLHLLARDHTRDLGGRPVRVSSPQGRAVALASRLDGRVLTAAEAYGKHLFHHWDGVEDVLHVHLGLFGKITRHASPPPPPATPNVRVRLEGVEWTVDLTGPTVCELLDLEGVERVLARLGPDPLRRDADPELAWTRLRRRRVPVGVAVMDQAVFAGVGNVFRAEALFVLGIHPERPANTITRDEFDQLWSTLTAMLRQALKDRRIVTVAAAELERPKAKLLQGEGRYVYRQERCRRCDREVRRWDLAGRWAYACESCQRL
jgi:endonuclease VIII